jgi:hypothetical protein
MKPTTGKPVPERIIVTASGSAFYDGVAVMLRFGMVQKNDFAYLAFLDRDGRAEITKSDYLRLFDEMINYALMDYHNPRGAFNGTVSADVMTQVQVEGAIHAHSLYSGFPYPEGYRECLINALRLIKTNLILPESMSTSIETL